MKTRLIAMVTICDGMVVQSFSYKNYLPVGSPEIICENLSRWGADEIIISFIDRSKSNMGPNLKILEKISKNNMSTPLIYSGGISSEQNAIDIINSGADRVAIEAIVKKDNINLINRISSRIGSQALILSMTLFEKNNKLFKFNYIDGSSQLFSDFSEVIKLLNFSEILLIDKENEGSKNFNLNLVDLFLKNLDHRILVFGGIADSKLIKKLLLNQNIKAIVIGNSLNYKEIQISNIKKKFKSLFRQVDYE
jgi:cyclase|tara:strand:+ start:294 stop:1046 length:753 start_codon:yes stop_codon:yes gene_type:complete